MAVFGHRRGSCRSVVVGRHQLKGDDRLTHAQTKNPAILTIIMYMKTLPLAQVRGDFSQLVDQAQLTHERITVTKNGRPAAVLMGIADYDSVMETLSILGDATLIAQIMQADEEFSQGEWHDEEEVRAAMLQAGRATDG